MKHQQLARVRCLILSVSWMTLPCAGDEKVTATTNALSSTTISGYVDSGGISSNTTASPRGLAGLWIGIITDRSSTNRIELCVAVDDAGGFAARGMNFDRTLGSDLIEGTSDQRGRASIGHTHFCFHRNGSATVIGRGQSGRHFSARLLRERIR